MITRSLSMLPALGVLVATITSCALVTSFDDYGVTAKSPRTSFFVRGSVVGLPDGKVTLVLNGRQLDVPNGPFTFPTALATGAPYALTVEDTPGNIPCTVANGSGTIREEDVDALVSCHP